jgi:hypothetical protein
VIRAVLGATAMLSAISPVLADTPPPTSAPPLAATSTATGPADAAQHGLAVGVEVGEPTSITVGVWTGNLGLSAALGTGTLEGVGLSFHVDAQLIVARLAPQVPLRVGLGGRFYHHGYDAMSFDEVPDSHYGIRASVALAYERGAMQLYAEAAPGVDVHRSASCTLASGAYSICPHTQEVPVFLQLVVGARWFLSH